MNIFRRELKAGRKTFLFWSIGLFFLVFTGMIKFTGIEAASGGVDVNALMDTFPKIALSVMGISDVDVTTLAGYHSVISYYTMICGIIYGIHLGSNSVSRELIDKTYEFVFTKPRSRQHILTRKLAAGIFYITGFVLLNLVFTLMALSVLKEKDNITTEVILYTLAIWLVSLWFFGIAAFLAATLKRAEKATLISNLYFLVVFVLGFLFDLMEKGRIIQFFTPIKFFEAADLVKEKMDPFYIGVTVVVILLALAGTYHQFEKRDLIS